MAEFLDQSEIDALLDICEDVDVDYGSPEFEELCEQYQNQTQQELYGTDPGGIYNEIKEKNKYYLKVLKEFKEFKPFYDRFKSLIKDQPELLI